jgi:hypothetical protein
MFVCTAALSLVGFVLLRRVRAAAAKHSFAAVGASISGCNCWSPEVVLASKLSSSSSSSLNASRQNVDVFVVYGVDDEAWVTGTLLDVIYDRYPCYDVLLQHHLDDTSTDGGVDCANDDNDSELADRKWNDPSSQLALSHSIDSSQMTIVVLSENFFRTLWTVPQLRGTILAKLDSQQHRFLFVMLDDAAAVDDVSGGDDDDRKQLYDCAAAHAHVSADGGHLAADRLLDYLLPPSGQHANYRQQQQSDGGEESMTLIVDGFARCRHDRY